MSETILRYELRRSPFETGPFTDVVSTSIAANATSANDQTANNDPNLYPGKTLYYQLLGITTPSTRTVPYRIGFISTLPAGTCLWAQLVGGEYADMPTGVAVDADGNVYAVGSLNQYGGTKNPFIRKLTSAGAFVQDQIYYAGSADSYFRAVAVDGAGNVLLTGHYSDDIDFNSPNGVNDQGSPTYDPNSPTRLDSQGSGDIFVVKLSPSGTHIWSKSIGSPTGEFITGGESGYAIASDSSNNVIVGGYFRGSITIGATTLTTAGGIDIFLAKYNSAGTVQWAKRFGSSSDDALISSSATPFMGVAADSSGNILLTGSYGGTINFGGSDLARIGIVGSFVAKFQPDGTHVWSKAFGSDGVNFGTGIKADSQGNALFCGGGGSTIRIGKLSSANGSTVWLKEIVANTGTSSSSAAMAMCLAVGSGDTAIVGLRAFGSFDPGGGTVASAGGWNGYVVKYTSAGAFVFVKQFPSAETSYVAGIAVDNTGRIVINGAVGSRTTVNCGNGITVQETGLGGWFVAKITQ